MKNKFLKGRLLAMLLTATVVAANAPINVFAADTVNQDEVKSEADISNNVFGWKNTMIKFEDRLEHYTYDGNPHELTAKVYADGVVIADAELLYTGTDVLGNVYHSKTAPTDAGFYQVTAIYEGDEKYRPAVSIHAALVITQILQKAKVTIPDRETVYRDDLTEFLEGIKDEVLTENLTERDREAILSTLRCEDSDDGVGSHNITADVLKSIQKNYLQDIQVEDGTHTIVPRDVTLVIDDQTITYGEDIPNLTFGFEEDVVTLEDFPYLVAGVETDAPYDYLDAGQYVISEGGLDNENFNVTVKRGTLVVNPKEVPIVIDRKQKYVGEEDPELTYQVDESELVGDDELGISLIRETGEEAGLYDIYVDSSEDALAKMNPNYKVTASDGTDKFEIMGKEEKPDPVDPDDKDDEKKPQKDSDNDKKKDKAKPKNTVATGDQTSMIGYIVGLAAALVAFMAAVVVIIRRRRIER